jgi:hypothetical protein
MHSISILGGVFVTLVLSMPATAQTALGTNDGRQIVNSTSPAWLGSIGQLSIPTRKWVERDYEHSNERCTATLLRDASHRRASRILTAWHCLEYYSDLSRSIAFKWTTPTGQTLYREARPNSHGGGMDSDWAIMSLNEPIDLADVDIPQPRPDGREVLNDASGSIALAGFSADEGLGNGGKHLTYQEECQTRPDPSDDIAINCIAFKGASGGPAIVNLRSPDGSEWQSWLVGVLSRGNGVDTSVLVVSDEFYPASLLGN